MVVYDGCTNRLVFVCFLMLCWCGIVHAQEDTTKQQSWIKLKALPLAYYTPETKIALEGFAYANWAANGTARKSNIRLFAVYTQKKQSLVILPWQVYTKNANTFFDGRLDYRRFPEYYYGLGNNTTEDVRHLYDFTAFTFENRGYRKVRDNLYFGLNTQLQDLHPVYPQSIQLFEDALGLGIKYGYSFFGIGPTLLWDSRDDILAAESGQYFEITSLFANGTTDMQSVDFFLIKVDFRSYKQLSRTTVWANQILNQWSGGEVPFRMLPTLGGAYLHRGYYQGRFRDRHLLLLQSEIRHPLNRRFGLTAFTSVGRVYNTLADISPLGLHVAGGGGIRFKFDPKDKTNIRLDFAITPDSRGVYLYFAEAF